jgi:hypothetical protein
MRSAWMSLLAVTQTGVDVDRFLRGLLFQFAVTPERSSELGPYRLARSLKESGRSESWGRELEVLAQSDQLDEYNRVRAAMTLFNLLALDGDFQNAVETLRRLQIPASARAWLEARL